MKYCNIPIFVSHRGCPFACVFCNQKHITGVEKRVTGADADKIIRSSLATIGDRQAEAAFFGGSFTGIPADEQEELLSSAHKYIKSGQIVGIRLSTRPDYIDRNVLDRLKKYGVTTIELEVQSLDAEVLDLSGRGHTEQDVIDAVGMIKEYGCFSLGLQMMTGLPGDTKEKSIETGRKITALKPDFVRIYPALTVKDTEMERMYKRGEYTPQTVEDAVDVCKELVKLFEENNIDVIRVSLQTTDEICEGGSVVAGPYHPNFRELVNSSIYYDKLYDMLKNTDEKDVTVYVPSQDIPSAVGYKRCNIDRIKKNLGINLKIKAE